MDHCFRQRERALLPPATKLGQGYIFTGVCDSVNRGVPAPVLGVSAPGGGGCLVPGGVVWSQGGLGVPAPGGGTCSRRVWSGLVGGVPGGYPPGTATAAGSTHPTGMHSCLSE